MDNNFSLSEMEDKGQEVQSLKDIALKHISKISNICCNEMVEGYWESKPVSVGGGISISKTRKPDGRAAFCNAVDFLFWIVYPNSDSTFKDKYKEDWTGSSGNWEEKLTERKEIFRQINLMFERTNFFDAMTGKTE